MDELIKAIENFKDRLNGMQASAGISDKRRRAQELAAMMADPDFWKDRAGAQKLSQEVSWIHRELSFWDELLKRTSSLLAKSREADRAVGMRAELEKELSALEEELSAKEVEIFMNGAHDRSPAIVTIYGGAGGVDAQDWAMLLERMYLRFAGRNGWKATVLHRMPGQGGGIKNVMLRFEGPFAYGYLKTESGVHRLVRLSPFDADQARHTSFAMVEVLPELDEPTTIEVHTDDVRVDVFRSSGHGGQSVNTTDSAVRLTHIPTGITVVCQNERSQLQNKEQARRILLGKLERYYQAQREEERQQLRGEFTEAAWGNQIRSYVLHPYKMVKDHRTKFETKNPDLVLDGELMPFIEAQLRAERGIGRTIP